MPSSLPKTTSFGTTLEAPFMYTSHSTLRLKIHVLVAVSVSLSMPRRRRFHSLDSGLVKVIRVLRSHQVVYLNTNSCVKFRMKRPYAWCICVASPLSEKPGFGLPLKNLDTSFLRSRWSIKPQCILHLVFRLTYIGPVSPFATTMPRIPSNPWTLT